MGSEYVDCRWYVVIPPVVVPQYSGAPKPKVFVEVIITQIASSHPGRSTIRNFGLEWKELDWPNLTHSVDVVELLRQDVTVRSPAAVSFRLKSRAPHLTDSLLLWIGKVTNADLFRQLPVVRLSESAGYVTSPAYDGLRHHQPDYYKGRYRLHLPLHHSVVATFSIYTKINTDKRYCRRIFVVFIVGSVTLWKKCGLEFLNPKMYRDLITIEYVKQWQESGTGFKMMYAIVSRNQEPQEVSEGVFNCSVPHFEAFAPVLRCNLAMECVNKEDEKGCDFYNEQCGLGSFYTGTKCYTFFKHLPQNTWNDVYAACRQRGEELVSLKTPHDLDTFERLLTLKKGPTFCVHVGLHKEADGLKYMSPAQTMLYKHIWRWSDKTSAFFIPMAKHSRFLEGCAYYKLPFPDNFSRLHAWSCFEINSDDEMQICDFVCEKALTNNDTVSSQNMLHTAVVFSEANWTKNVVACAGGHVIRDYLSCDPNSQCGARDYLLSCPTEGIHVPMFVCEPSMATVHYSLVCDRVEHCPDNTDESFCVFDSCSALTCQDGQCLRPEQLCDRKIQCLDFSDEKTCSKNRIAFMTSWIDTDTYMPSSWPPFVVNINEVGAYTLEKINSSDDCPSTHFICPGGICLPLYLRCNNIDDCPGREDEAGCESYTCPGLYRCWGSQVCLYPEQVCDGVRHCPRQDDELLCDLDPCPTVCKCQALAFVCSQSFNVSSHSNLRLLDASGSGMTLESLERNTFLVYTDLSHCGITRLQRAILPNLRHLDLSWNLLSHVDMKYFIHLENLLVLILSRNPLSSITNEFYLSDKMNLRVLDLSYSSVKVYNGTVLTACPDLRSINLSWSRVTEIADGGFATTPLLQTLDTRQSLLTLFPNDVLRNLTALKTVYTDIFKLCCSAMLPDDFDLKNCHTKEDLLASCEDMLKSNAYRVFLWCFAALAIMGNFGSFLARVYLDKASLGSFGVFVINLTVSDFFMGVYLAIVGAADLVYQGRYLFHDMQWKNSITCKTAGFFSLLSCEVSALNICLITLDRFLVLRFPFSQVHFGRTSAVVSCVVIWTIGCVLAAIPLLPTTSHWQFFSQTGVCIPLPFTNSDSFPGYTYSFTVMIMLNFLLFGIIACGQVVIYRSVQANSLSSTNKDSAAKNAIIARRLTIVVVSDFVCWFPIGLLGVLASAGVPIQDELNVAVAIFVLPINSALNPFLYTFNVVMEKRRKAREARLLKDLEEIIRLD